MKIFNRLICRFRGHIPIHDGHVLAETYGNYFFMPEFEKVPCFRCGRFIGVLNGMSLEKVDRWELSERCKRSLKVHKLLDTL